MPVATKELTVEEKSCAMPAPKAEAIRVGDDELFAPVPARKSVKPLAFGTALAGQPIVIKPVATELDAMAADLTALRAGEVAPIATMNAETLTAIEDEHIGAEHSIAPYLY